MKGILLPSADFGAVIDYLVEGSNLSQVATDLQIERSQLYRWKKGAATPSPRMRRDLFDAMKAKMRKHAEPTGAALEAFVAAGGKVAAGV